jgi:circadian clock protein KaiB
MTRKIREKWILFLYIAGMTPAAKRALANVRTICEEHLKGDYSLEVIDLIDHPALAEDQQIFAVPTLVRQLPPPLRKIIGDMADSEKVVVGLDIQAVA